MALPREVIQIGCIALTVVVGLQVLTANAEDPAARAAELRAREIKAVLFPWTASQVTRTAHALVSNRAELERLAGAHKFDPNALTPEESAAIAARMKAVPSPKARSSSAALAADGDDDGGGGGGDEQPTIVTGETTCWTGDDVPSHCGGGTVLPTTCASGNVATLCGGYPTIATTCPNGPAPTNCANAPHTICPTDYTVATNCPGLVNPTFCPNGPTTEVTLCLDGYAPTNCQESRLAPGVYSTYCPNAITPTSCHNQYDTPTVCTHEYGGTVTLATVCGQNFSTSCFIPELGPATPTHCPNDHNASVATYCDYEGQILPTQCKYGFHPTHCPEGMITSCVPLQVTVCPSNPEGTCDH